ncbi:histidine triad (HIT) family protein [Capnocytophaga haemolytica]|jgi:histidine triad protein|uniref:HIT family hydrolase n=1 Tax=Capnocytophaga haemolytica TaxID=45243 RepID=A0AAX2GZT3_9FLAO|nr:HIT domain-containing protein [Capnocytophaga haemolytica]AMD84607.1 HIT family hydrolase [Capnocytophaga haemolytica]SFO00408.1 histidine triad (HIT) family protein [Capnocytophaga haemolytica]SNV08984.1 purine nucleoside phosphoramidase [Capnocytophaga haemolytica]
MASIFTKIINGEIPCYKVAENDDFIAFFDINPNAKGHTLCVPKKEVNKIFEMDDKHYLDLMLFSKRVAEALAKVVPCKRVGMAVVGLEVPHTHVHLIPISEMKEMTFEHKVQMTDEEFKALAKAVGERFQA